jgi:hypothetical protein
MRQEVSEVEGPREGEGREKQVAVERQERRRESHRAKFADEPGAGRPRDDP